MIITHYHKHIFRKTVKTAVTTCTYYFYVGGMAVQWLGLLRHSIDVLAGPVESLHVIPVLHGFPLGSPSYSHNSKTCM